jgi:heme/copper-type cytochrome/quinol oxidase subunit 1
VASDDDARRDRSPAPRRGAALPAVLVVVGAALLAAGAGLASRWSSGSGWFAYAPLSGTTFAPSPSPAPGLVLAVVAAGGILVGLGVGLAVGRRRGDG